MAPDNNKARKHGPGEPLKPAEPPEEVLLPDTYARNDWDPDRQPEDRPAADDEAEGFNPYDTAALHNK